ncbi:hypothetical protein GCM10010174_75720 [Kutzneria viridogrisea]|uniref:Uncharacterized protein n=1 Tax=Kutzneria viridogrisea TaxID=47990 RepID=A0ABR6BN81_9PSEU|nr:bacteriophage holin [Kutzneria albida]MBA8928358.1 hypothetical protein [Kutzneria viridogrisea]
MPYLPSALLIILGLVLLVLALLRVFRSLRGLSSASRLARARFSDRSGLLRARVAALGVAIAERRRNHWGRRDGGERAGATR